MRSIKALLLYQSVVMLITDVIAITLLLFSYHPDANKISGKVGIGGIVLDCTFWSILFAASRSLSLLNIYESVRKNFLISLLSFFVGPSFFLLIENLLQVKEVDLFGFSQTAWTFFIIQSFFFARFRYLLKSNKSFGYPAGKA